MEKHDENLWFYDCFFFALEKLYYLLGWKLNLGSTNMGTLVLIIFLNHSNQFLWELVIILKKN
jgi:hypothetical protein